MALPTAEMMDQLQELHESGQAAEGLVLFSDLHPADVADILENMPAEMREDYFKALDPETGAEVLMELEEAQRSELIKLLSTGELAGLLLNMDSDDAADVVSELPPEQAPEVLTRIDKEDQQEVRKLLTYPEDSAGGLMQMELVTVPQEVTIGQALSLVREQAREIEDFNNVFVISSDRQLVGILSLRDMLLARPDTPVAEEMNPPQVTLRPEDDQEEVGQVFQKYDLISAPVVDTRGRLLGRVTVDDVVDVIQEEASEDIYRSVGTGDEELAFGEASFKISRRRLPWILANLVGGLLASYFLSLFEVTLAEAIVLVTFIPVIIAMGGNVGIQTSTIFVRALALGSFSASNIWRVLGREMRVAVIIGTTCGGLTGLAATIWHGRPVLGLIVGLSMFIDILLAAAVGVSAPAFFKRLDVDPAIASGPLVTTANDILGILVYLGIATFFLSHF